MQIVVQQSYENMVQAKDCLLSFIPQGWSSIAIFPLRYWDKESQFFRSWNSSKNGKETGEKKKELL